MREDITRRVDKAIELLDPVDNVAIWMDEFRADTYEARQPATARQRDYCLRQTNDMYTANGDEVEFDIDELQSGYRYSSQDHELLSAAVLAKNWAEALRVALMAEARSVYRRFDRHIDYAISREAERKEVERKDAQVDNYIERHTAYEWEGPAMNCQCRTLQYDRCGRKGKFVSLETRTRSEGYGDDRRTVQFTFARLECSAHATRFPKEQARYNYKDPAWACDAYDEELAQFAVDQAPHLAELVDGEGVTLTTMEAFMNPVYVPVK